MPSWLENTDLIDLGLSIGGVVDVVYMFMPLMCLAHKCGRYQSEWCEISPLARGSMGVLFWRSSGRLTLRVGCWIWDFMLHLPVIDGMRVLHSRQLTCL